MGLPVIPIDIESKSQDGYTSERAVDCTCTFAHSKKGVHVCWYLHYRGHLMIIKPHPKWTLTLWPIIEWPYRPDGLPLELIEGDTTSQLSLGMWYLENAKIFVIDTLLYYMYSPQGTKNDPYKLKDCKLQGPRDSKKFLCNVYVVSCVRKVRFNYRKISIFFPFMWFNNV